MDLVGTVLLDQMNAFFFYVTGHNPGERLTQINRQFVGWQVAAQLQAGHVGVRGIERALKTFVNFQQPIEVEGVIAFATELFDGLEPCGHMAGHFGRIVDDDLVMRLCGWQGDALFVVMRDQDSGNCVDIKAQLSALCEEAGHPDALVRIACRELESFYLGDLAAVEQGLKVTGLARQQGNQKFRDPDRLVNAAEELKKITKNSYQKLSGSRSIAPFLRLDEGHRSTSFKALISGLQRLLHEA